jgi:hypothetical protein
VRRTNLVGGAGSFSDVVLRRGPALEEGAGTAGFLALLLRRVSPPMGGDLPRVSEEGLSKGGGVISLAGASGAARIPSRITARVSMAASLAAHLA